MFGPSASGRVRSFNDCNGWDAHAMMLAVVGTLMGKGDVMKSWLAWIWIGMAWLDRPVRAVMVGRSSPMKARFLASW